MRLAKIALIGAGLLGAIVASAPKADAAYVIDVTQDGNNVVATGSGSFNLAALTFSFVSNFGFPVTGGITGGFGVFEIGTSSSFNNYQGILGPDSFGGSAPNPDASTGPFVGVQGSSGGYLFIPVAYVSGQPLPTSTATFDNTTIAGLGLIPGAYTWTWGNGADADSFTVDIPSTSIPEPASLTLIGTGLLGLAASSRRKD